MREVEEGALHGERHHPKWKMTVKNQKKQKEQEEHKAATKWKEVTCPLNPRRVRHGQHQRGHSLAAGQAQGLTFVVDLSSHHPNDAQIDILSAGMGRARDHH